MANLNKKTIDGIGGVLTAVIVGAGVFYGVLPQIERASSYQDQSSGVEEAIEINNLRLTQLISYADDPDELMEERETLRESVPEEPDVPSIQRAIVDSLGAFDLEGFSHAPTMVFERPAAPVLSLEESEAPFDVDADAPSGEAAEPAEPVEGGDGVDNPDDGVDVLDPGAANGTGNVLEDVTSSGSSVKAVPVVIDISIEGTSASQLNTELAEFLERVESDDRLILVLKTTSGITESSATEESPASVSMSTRVHLYAFTTE